MDLGALLLAGPDGTPRTGEQIRGCSRAWLTGALDAAGVTLGTHDRFVIGLIADDGWSTVQVIAGWIARVHNNSADVRENGRGPPPSRKSVALSGRI